VRRLHKQAPGVAMPRFGDGAMVTALARLMRAGHQAQIGVAGRMVQNPTLARRQGKEHDFIEDLNAPFRGAHRIPCSPRRDPSACPGCASWKRLLQDGHDPSVFARAPRSLAARGFDGTRVRVGFHMRRPATPTCIALPISSPWFGSLPPDSARRFLLPSARGRPLHL
jgi:hypothetical protein